MHVTRVRVQHNSMYMLIPKDIAEKLKLKKGDYLIVDIKGKELIVKKLELTKINS